MLRAAILALVVSVLLPALAIQVPLGSGDRWKDKHPAVLSDDDPTEWSPDTIPNPNTTDHLVFETVYSLLHIWPNSRMANGHNIVPGTIPEGTLLYHGGNNNALPPGPEWVAMDSEHAYSYCGGQQECWFLTLVTARPLRIIYFDGSSAGKSPDGPLDAQDLIIWGASRPEDVYDESRRIRDLCEWVQQFGVDGIVRSSRCFEVMLCDFTSGVSVVSFANIVHAHGATISQPVLFEVLVSGSRNYHFPGETRVKLDLTGLVSFYDTQLVPSLVAARAGQERWQHRVRNISSKDLSAVKSTIEAAMSRPSGRSSGIDWRTIIQVIVDRFSQRLELMRHLLNSLATESNDLELLDLANKTQTQLRIMLTPYILLSTTPTDPLNRSDLDWTIPTYKLCATTHTHLMESKLDSMTDSEKLILHAVRGTSQEICRVVTRMWAAGVHAGIDPSLNTKDPLDIAEVTHIWRAWVNDLDRLMAWLDWSLWVKCNPACGPEEICYLYEWPFQIPMRFPTSLDLKDVAMDKPLPLLAKERPKPRCIRRDDP